MSEDEFFFFLGLRCFTVRAFKNPQNCDFSRGYIFSFSDPHAFERHLHLVNRADLETILRVEVFVNEGDH